MPPVRRQPPNAVRPRDTSSGGEVAGYSLASIFCAGCLVLLMLLSLKVKKEKMAAKPTSPSKSVRPGKHCKRKKSRKKQHAHYCQRQKYGSHRHNHFQHRYHHHHHHRRHWGRRSPATMPLPSSPSPFFRPRGYHHDATINSSRNMGTNPNHERRIPDGNSRHKREYNPTPGPPQFPIRLDGDQAVDGGCENIPGYGQRRYPAGVVDGMGMPAMDY